MSRRQIGILVVLALLVLVSVNSVILTEIRAEELPDERVLGSACANNLKQIGLVLNMFAHENKGRFPGIDDIEGNLIFEGDQLYPQFLTDVQILGCPGDTGYFSSNTFRLTDDSSHSSHNVGEPHVDCITSESYIYLGWLVSNEEQGLTTIAAYRNASLDALEKDIEVPQGKGNGGGGRIYRLQAGVDRFLITDINTIFKEPIAATVPIMWEWPSNHGGGGNVLYLDGHVEFVPYPGKFPMAEKFIETLRNLEAEISRDCSPIKTK
jgi:prepilin-type processing-associated H-X9-DG protein